MGQLARGWGRRVAETSSKVQWFVLEPGDMFYMGGDPTKNVFTFLGRYFTDAQQFVFLARRVGDDGVDLSAFTDKHEATLL